MQQNATKLRQATNIFCGKKTPLNKREMCWARSMRKSDSMIDEEKWINKTNLSEHVDNE